MKTTWVARHWIPYNSTWDYWTGSDWRGIDGRDAYQFKTKKAAERRAAKRPGSEATEMLILPDGRLTPLSAHLAREKEFNSSVDKKLTTDPGCSDGQDKH